MYILNKQQQLKDSTLQNGILGQSTKNTDIFMFFLNGSKEIDGIIAYTANSIIWALYRE